MVISIISLGHRGLADVVDQFAGRESPHRFVIEKDATASLADLAVGVKAVIHAWAGSRSIEI